MTRDGGSSARVDEPDAYQIVKSGVVVFERPGRKTLVVTGRAPGQMLGGVLTGRTPGALADQTPAGSRAYSTILTPKGKMVSDLYLYRLPGEEEAFLIDLPEAGQQAVRELFGKVLPPRFARVEPASGEYHLVTVAGPRSAEAVGTLLGGSEANLTELSSDEVTVLDGVVVARSFELSVPSFDLLVPAERWPSVRESLPEDGLPGGEALTDGSALWDVLRVEAGTPAFGTDMDDTTIPIEAGIDERAIDHTKGCYTGQEVIVRIRHRGHVNRHLRSLEMATDGQADPGRGDELFAADVDKAVGTLTSVAWSPDAGRWLGLGYVRREVELGAEVRVGGRDGRPATVLERS